MTTDLRLQCTLHKYWATCQLSSTSLPAASIPQIGNLASIGSIGYITYTLIPDLPSTSSCPFLLRWHHWQLPRKSTFELLRQLAGSGIGCSIQLVPRGALVPDQIVAHMRSFQSELGQVHLPTVIRAGCGLPWHTAPDFFQ